MKRNGIKSCSQPPSTVIKAAIKNNSNPNENDIQAFAKKCLLSVSDTRYLVDHLRVIEQRKELRKKAKKAKKGK